MMSKYDCTQFYLAVMFSLAHCVSERVGYEEQKPFRSAVYMHMNPSHLTAATCEIHIELILHCVLSRNIWNLSKLHTLINKYWVNCINKHQAKGRKYPSYPACGQPQFPAWAGGWPRAGTMGLIRETGHPVHQEPQSGLLRSMSPISLPGWPAPSSTFLAGFAMLLFCPGGLYPSTIPRDRRYSTSTNLLLA